MTTFLLVRHAAAQAPPGVLIGRNRELGLSVAGKDRAGRLARRLRGLPISSVWSSPLMRAIDTATVIASELTLPVQISEAMNEVDYGEWTGRSFAELESDPRWRSFNTVRSQTAVPGGESMQQVEHRVAERLELWAQHYPANLVVVVTHAEIIRIAVLQTLGLPIDCFDRIEISPGSICALSWSGYSKRLICLNEGGELKGRAES